ncbi:MAG: c-type cytochrome [Anaerolineales bacterium]
MNTQLFSKRTILIFAIVSVLLAACGLISQGTKVLSSSGTPGELNASNGERIYFTSINNAGDRISYSDGPKFGGMMMGTYLTCASCHGPEARGGTHRMHMQVMDAPDIRYATLSTEEDEHEQGQDGGHEAEHGEYDIEAFRLAVIEGKHPDGAPLSINMPRWQMSDDDLNDLYEFLKSIP